MRPQDQSVCEVPLYVARQVSLFNQELHLRPPRREEPPEGMRARTCTAPPLHVCTRHRKAYTETSSEFCSVPHLSRQPSPLPPLSPSPSLSLPPPPSPPLFFSVIKGFSFIRHFLRWCPRRGASRSSMNGGSLHKQCVQSSLHQNSLLEMYSCAKSQSKSPKKKSTINLIIITPSLCLNCTCAISKNFNVRIISKIC